MAVEQRPHQINLRMNESFVWLIFILATENSKLTGRDGLPILGFFAGQKFLPTQLPVSINELNWWISNKHNIETPNNINWTRRGSNNKTNTITKPYWNTNTNY